MTNQKIEKASDEDIKRWFDTRMYMIRIKQKDNLSNDYIRKYGVPSVGDKQLDIQILNSPIDVYKKIPEIMELYQKGTDIVFPRLPDITEIYELSNELLIRLSDKISTGVNLGTYNFDEIKQLDAFLSVLFPLAAPGIPRKTSLQELMQGFSFNKTEQVHAMREHQSKTINLDLLYGQTPVIQNETNNEEGSPTYSSFKFN